MFTPLNDIVIYCLGSGEYNELARKDRHIVILCSVSSGWSIGFL